MSVKCQETIMAGDLVWVSSQQQGCWLEAFGHVIGVRDNDTKIDVKLTKILKQHGSDHGVGCIITVGREEVELYTGDRDKYA